MFDFITRQANWYTQSGQQLARFTAIVRFHNVMQFSDDLLACFNVGVTIRNAINDTSDKAEDLMVQYFNHINKKLLK